MTLGFYKNIGTKLPLLSYTFYQIQLKQIENIIGETFNLVLFSVDIRSFF